jgi:hypothetical protein
MHLPASAAYGSEASRRTDRNATTPLQLQPGSRCMAGDGQSARNCASAVLDWALTVLRSVSWRKGSCCLRHVHSFLRSSQSAVMSPYASSADAVPNVRVLWIDPPGRHCLDPRTKYWALSTQHSRQPVPAQQPPGFTRAHQPCSRVVGLWLSWLWRSSSLQDVQPGHMPGQKDLVQEGQMLLEQARAYVIR